MIPVTTDTPQVVIASSQPGKTYKIDFAAKRIVGHVDNFDAVDQFIRKCLETEKHAYLIYKDYGVGIEKYVGQDFNLVKYDLPREITESLMTDDRILSVAEFDISEGTNSDDMVISFKVTTIYGGKDYSVTM